MASPLFQFDGYAPGEAFKGNMITGFVLTARIADETGVRSVQWYETGRAYSNAGNAIAIAPQNAIGTMVQVTIPAVSQLGAAWGLKCVINGGDLGDADIAKSGVFIAHQISGIYPAFQGETTEFGPDGWTRMGSGGTGSGAISILPMNGDVTGNTAANAVANNVITLAKLQDISTDRLLGRDTAGTGDPELISLNSTLEFTGAGSIQRAALTGDVTASAGSNTTTIAGNAVTLAKIQQISTDRLLGRDTAGTGDVEVISLNSSLSFTGSGQLQRSALTGDVSASAGSNATTIGNSVVTFAKMQNVGTDCLLGRDTGGTGDIETISLNSSLSFTGSGQLQRSALTGDVSAYAGLNSTEVRGTQIGFVRTMEDEFMGNDTYDTGYGPFTFSAYNSGYYALATGTNQGTVTIITSSSANSGGTFSSKGFFNPRNGQKMVFSCVVTTSNMNQQTLLGFWNTTSATINATTTKHLGFLLTTGAAVQIRASDGTNTAQDPISNLTPGTEYIFQLSLDNTNTVAWRIFGVSGDEHDSGSFSINGIGAIDNCFVGVRSSATAAASTTLLTLNYVGLQLQY